MKTVFILIVCIIFLSSCMESRSSQVRTARAMGAKNTAKKNVQRKRGPVYGQGRKIDKTAPEKTKSSKPQKKQVPGKKTQAVATSISPSMKALKTKLSVMISLNFSPGHIRDVIAHISRNCNVPMVIDPLVYEQYIDPDSLYVDMVVHNIKALDALNTILALKGLSYRIENDGQLLSIFYFPTGSSIVFYDVKDLCGKDPNNPVSMGFTEEDIVELVKASIPDGNWESVDTSIEARSGVIAVRQSKGVHQEIQNLLNDMRLGASIINKVERGK